MTAARAEGPAPARGAASAGFNVVELIDRFAARAPDRAALVEVDAEGATRASTSFGALSGRVHDVARALARKGVKPGDRAALFVTGGTDFVTLVYALFRLGAVPVLIDPGMGVKNMLACVAEQRPAALVGVAKAHVLRALARGAFATVRHAVLVGGRYFPGATSLSGLLSSLAPQDARDAPHAPSADEPAAILYTSGSTGTPKGVVYTHAMLGGQAEAIARMFAAEGAPIEEGDVDVSCFLPFALFSVALGMTAVFPAMDFRKPAAADPRAVLAALSRTGAKSAFASPALWEPFSRFLVEQKLVLPTLRRVLTAGAPVRPQLHERMLSAMPDGDVYTPYGATEALPVALIGGRRVLAETAEKTRAGAGTCVGSIAPGMEVRILRLTDEPIEKMTPDLALPTGEVGEIVVRGAVVTRTYDGKPEATRLAKIEDGDTYWHRMGDLGYLDEQGRLWFCGRKSHRVETVDGLLTSVPVEAVFEGHPAVSRAALVGLGPRPRQVPVVCIELVPGHAATDALKDEILAVAHRHAHARSVRHLLFHPRFPVDRRHNAKIEREALARFAEQKLPEVARSAAEARA